jgi:hypothetical protein
MVAYLVENGEITEDQALEIFQHPERFKWGFEVGKNFIIMEINRLFHV